MVEQVVDFFQLETNAHHIDVVALGHLVGEEQRAVVLDFDEAVGDRELLLFAALVVGDDAGAQRGEQRQVPRQHAELALHARRGRPRRPASLQREPVRRDDLER